MKKIRFISQKSRKNSNLKKVSKLENFKNRPKNDLLVSSSSSYHLKYPLRAFRFWCWFCWGVRLSMKKFYVKWPPKPIFSYFWVKVKIEVQKSQKPPSSPLITSISHFYHGLGFLKWYVEFMSGLIRTWQSDFR